MNVSRLKEGFDGDWNMHFIKLAGLLLQHFLHWYTWVKITLLFVIIHSCHPSSVTGQDSAVCEYGTYILLSSLAEYLSQKKQFSALFLCSNIFIYKMLNGLKRYYRIYSNLCRPRFLANH